MASCLKGAGSSAGSGVSLSASSSQGPSRLLPGSTGPSTEAQRLGAHVHVLAVLFLALLDLSLEAGAQMLSSKR